MSEEDRRFPYVPVAMALTKAARELGWRPVVTQAADWRVTLVVLPPLAQPDAERNRWPDEPQEAEEPTEEERRLEWAPDWDTNTESPALGVREVDDLGQPVNQVLGGKSDGA